MKITKTDIRKTKLEILNKYYKDKLEEDKKTVKEEAANIFKKIMR